MTVFVIVALLLTATCVAIALVPMWRRPQAARDRRRNANIEVYRQRCREIEAEVAAGRLGEADARAERDAHGARLLADVDADDIETAMRDEATPKTTGRPWVASLLAGVLIIGLGGFGYYALGDWQALEAADMPNVDELVAQLADHVADNPGDRGARLMLAEAYRDRGQYEKAAEQLRAVNARARPPQAELLVAEAQARLSAGEALQDRPGQLFQQALVQDPSNKQALWFLGLRAAEADRRKAAVGFWDRLLAQDLPPQVRDTVKSRRNALAGDIPSLQQR